MISSVFQVGESNKQVTLGFASEQTLNEPVEVQTKPYVTEPMVTESVVTEPIVMELKAASSPGGLRMETEVQLEKQGNVIEVQTESIVSEPFVTEPIDKEAEAVSSLGGSKKEIEVRLETQGMVNSVEE